MPRPSRWSATWIGYQLFLMPPASLPKALENPKLDHEWLWFIFNAKKRTEVSIDDEFDETEDLPEPKPKQELMQPDLVIDVPPVDPSVLDDGTFDVGDIPPPPKPLEDWGEALARIEYDPVAAEITRVNITGVIGRELGGEGWTTVHSAPDGSDSGGAAVEISDDAIRDAVRDDLLKTAEELTVVAGYATTFKDRVYSALLHHVRAKFLNGASLGLADPSEVEFAWKMLNQVKKNVSEIPGLVAGVIEYGN